MRPQAAFTIPFDFNDGVRVTPLRQAREVAFKENPRLVIHCGVLLYNTVAPMYTIEIQRNWDWPQYALRLFSRLAAANMLNF